jgi:condensin-2 complex subunit D3
MATVRAKAIANIALLFQEAANNPVLLKDILIIKLHHQHSSLNSFLQISQVFETNPSAIMKSSSEQENTDLLSLLRRRVGDDKSGVRKSALQALEMFIRFSDITQVKAEDLTIFQTQSKDPAVSIRKQCVESLTELLRLHPFHSVICKLWLRSVLPLVCDPESTVQDKCLDYVEELIFEEVTKFSK